MQFLQPDPSKQATIIKTLRIAIVSAGLSHLGEPEAAHSKLVRSAVEGAKRELSRLGVDVDKNLMEIECPGVLEIPLMSLTLIKKHSLDGVIACALVVNGGIYRHEFVAQTSLDILMKVSLETNTPIASCMLTPVEPNSPQTQYNMLLEHLSGKGVECAGALIRQILQLKTVDKAAA